MEHPLHHKLMQFGLHRTSLALPEAISKSETNGIAHHDKRQVEIGIKSPFVALVGVDWYF